MTTILVVDDDPRIVRVLQRYLQQEGFHVNAVGSGHEMFGFLSGARPDLVLLDLMLPDRDGLELARELRSRYKIPIIMLTGKSDTVDKIIGLEMGADDYITKPFDERELLARVRSVLRRTHKRAEESDTANGTIACFGGWQLDFNAYTLTSPSAETIRLTHQEFQLLALFVKQPNRALTRDAILDHIAQRDYTPYDRSIDVLIAKVRKKIEPDPKEPSFIKTIRGAGYVFTPAVEFIEKLDD